MDDNDLFLHLGDNPQKYLCWSASSRRVPTFRLLDRKGKLFHVRFSLDTLSPY